MSSHLDRPTKAALLPALMVAAALAACSTVTDKPSESLGPPVPSGATIIPGEPMEPTPNAPSLKVPTSQQEARDTVLRYLQQTVDGLPKSSTLDGSRYGGSRTFYCDDEPADENSPVRFEDWRDVRLPAGATTGEVVAQVGDMWKSLGWQVIEKDGFPKPNRFGYPPDGYSLQITARDNPSQPPSLIAVSPCFPGNLKDDSVPNTPPLLSQTAHAS
ncbi:Uncharacterised protein [Mycobacteroides abscessus subsp. massiliense]|nr:Uncharacterised protein [Mycobacteroides abscessus subsp. massiliense]SKW11876.1 Uncharacterised protein [Mycobacteroides abscessus subsp. massiliense]